MSFDLKIKNGDIVETLDGDIDIVTGIDKAKQDIVKMIITQQGENKFHPILGSLLNKRLIGKVIPNNTMISVLSGSVSEAIGYLITLQKNQKLTQILDPGEEIVEIKDISIKRDLKEPRQINIILYLRVASGDIVAEAMTMRLG